jgi:hypothetical protein
MPKKMRAGLNPKGEGREGGGKTTFYERIKVESKLIFNQKRGDY